DRRFIAVQLPEPTPEGSEARQAGFKTISDICIARIKRFMAAVTSKEAAKLKLNSNNTLSLGVRAFRLANSSYKPWTGVEGNDEEQYAQQLEAFADPLVDG